ncbi:hypothetical protein [Streptomyces sp. Tu 3180]|uniref:hypothetical protein n=1 Tax=Streptomyces sp. Tu 3180 TaxID=2682611 RepID=UPI00135BF736|nr:hypothetical protein [Streptomyces sp. Tu 3180]KAF3463425.1 hypothetical protein GL259_03190 [Streptomyces sp. Tu 3180]
MQTTERRRRVGTARRALSALRRPLVRGAATVASLAVGSTALVGFGSPAYAATACGAQVSKQLVAHMDGYSFNVSHVQYCPIWKSNTPVYNKPYTTRQVVGDLVYAGSSNWFVCRSSSYTDTYSAYGYSSKDWAITMADNGRWGWVPAVYFNGSENYWAGLRQCTTYEYP